MFFNVCLHSHTFPLHADWRKSDCSVDGEPQENLRWNSNSRDAVASSPSFSRPAARVLRRACSQVMVNCITKTMLNYRMIYFFNAQDPGTLPVPRHLVISGSTRCLFPSSWPRSGCCSWDDSHLYELKQRGKTSCRVFIPRGVLSRRIPCPAFNVVDVFSGLWKPLAPVGIKKMTVLLFWTKW